jgi:hypothetical protein
MHGPLNVKIDSRIYNLGITYVWEGLFSHGEKASCTLWIWVCVGPTDGADGVVKLKFSVINVVYTAMRRYLDVKPFSLENSVPTFRRNQLTPSSWLNSNTVRRGSRFSVMFIPTTNLHDFTFQTTLIFRKKIPVPASSQFVYIWCSVSFAGYLHMAVSTAGVTVCVCVCVCFLIYSMLHYSL